jgi:probable rRNA maturation factor
MLRVTIASPQNIVPFSRPHIKKIARAVLKGEGITAAKINLAFVDNATIHRLNKQFLNHDQPTDVITFPLSSAGATALEGEVVIGAEVARARAAELGHDERHELALYVIHGLLHLCGYDDTTRAAARSMRARERRYLALLGLPDIAEPGDRSAH